MRSEGADAPPSGPRADAFALERAARQRELSFRAGLIRVVLAFVVAFVAPLFQPALGGSVILARAYFVVALAIQFLIYKGYGHSQARAIASGVLDVAVLTYIVHFSGSITSAALFVYVLIGVGNAFSNGPRVAVTLMIIGTVAYVGLLVAEGLRLVPFAPGTPWLNATSPGIETFVATGGIFVVSMGITTLLVGHLAKTVMERENELARLNERLGEISERDALTGLYNRRHLLGALEREIGRVRRGHELAVMMIDLDKFKQVNDAFGHARGDAVLVDVARAIDEATRSIDIAARQGGDEFVILLPDTSREGALGVAKRLIERIRNVGLEVNRASPVTASVGLTRARETDDPSSVLSRADERAYRAKRAGGDGVVAD